MFYPVDLLDSVWGFSVGFRRQLLRHCVLGLQLVPSVAIINHQGKVAYNTFLSISPHVLSVVSQIKEKQ